MAKRYTIADTIDRFCYRWRRGWFTRKDRDQYAKELAKIVDICMEAGITGNWKVVRGDLEGKNWCRGCNSKIRAYFLGDPKEKI